MKSSLLFTACTALSLLAGCDSGSSPTQVETKIVRDTTIWNTQFAKKSDMIHGRWLLRTPTDTADMWIFQDGDSLNAVLYWGKTTDWRIEGKLEDGTYVLYGAAGKIEVDLFVQEVKEKKANKLKVDIFDKTKTPRENSLANSAERRL